MDDSHTILNQSQKQSNINPGSVNTTFPNELSKFSPYGQKAIVEVKKNGTLVDFARNMPTPKERKKLLAENIKAKNSDIWAKYVFGKHSV